MGEGIERNHYAKPRQCNRIASPLTQQDAAHPDARCNLSDTCRRTRAASACKRAHAARIDRRADLNLFISYRRSETSGYSGRIYDRLRAALPDADVFIDVERIDPGRNWREELAERIRAADAVL